MQNICDAFCKESVIFKAVFLKVRFDYMRYNKSCPYIKVSIMNPSNMMCIKSSEWVMYNHKLCATLAALWQTKIQKAQVAPLTAVWRTNFQKASVAPSSSQLVPIGPYAIFMGRFFVIDISLV